MTSRSPTRPNTVGGVTVFVVLAAIVFLPSVPRYLFSATSGTVGLVLACGIIIGLGITGFYKFEGGRHWQVLLMILAGTGFFIVFHALVASLWSTPSAGRMIGSLAVLAVMMGTAYQVRTVLRAASPAAVEYAMTVIAGILVLIAVLSVLNIQPASTIYFGKPIFPFTEPSHFALAFAPVLIFHCVNGRLTIRMLWLSGALVLAYVLQNLTLIVVVALAAACCLPGLWLGGGLVVVGVIASGLNITYFTDRLDLSEQTTNLSSLIYLQGGELAGLGLRSTSGWGLGFQQLGFVPLNSPTSDVIFRILGDDSNLRDGGWLAAKLVAEFGYFGVLIAVLSLYVSVRSVLFLRGSIRDREQRSVALIFVYSVMAALMIEMFVRGLGYFSSETLLFLAAQFVALEYGMFKKAPQLRTQDVG